MKKQNKSAIHPFLKMAGVKSEKEFYQKFPTDEDFFNSHPQARYGIRMAEDSVPPIPGPSADQGGVGIIQGPPGMANTATGALPNAKTGPQFYTGPMYDPKKKNKKTSPVKPDTSGGEDSDTSDSTPDPSSLSADVQQKKQKKHQFAVNPGDKTWNPFAKDNAWNTGTGINTPDMVAGATAIAAGALPFQPVRKNQQLLPPAVTTGNYGYGSQASFEDGGMMTKGGKLSAKKARQILHDGSVHGNPLTEKQRKYFGAVASNYAADGTSMITQVEPSPYTYFRPMTKQMRQRMDIPNAYARNGMEITGEYHPDHDMEMMNAYPHKMGGMYKPYHHTYIMEQGGQLTPQEMDAWNAYHASQFQNNPAYGTDVLNHGNIGQQNIQAWNVAHPDQAINKPIQAYQQSFTSTPLGRSAVEGFPGSKTTASSFMNYERQNIDAHGNVSPVQKFGTDVTAFAKAAPGQQQPMQAPAPVQGTTMNYQKPQMGTPAVDSTGYQSTHVSGFPTLEQAKAKAHSNPDNFFMGKKEQRQQGKAEGQAFAQKEKETKAAQRTYAPMGEAAYGAMIPMGQDGLQVEGNQFRYLSPQTIELVGPKHENGGINIAYNGNRVEAEGGETFHVDNGDMYLGGNMAASGASMNAGIVGGNLYVPGTKTKFKDAFKENAKKERAAAKIQDRASYFMNEYAEVGSGPMNQYQGPAANYGKVLSDIYEQKKAQNEMVKNTLTETQNKMLELGEMIDPEHGAKKVSQMFRGTAKWGKQIPKAEWGHNEKRGTVADWFEGDNNTSTGRTNTPTKVSDKPAIEKKTAVPINKKIAQVTKGTPFQPIQKQYLPSDLERKPTDWTGKNYEPRFEPNITKPNFSYIPSDLTLPTEQEELFTPSSVSTSEKKNKKGKGLREKHYLDPSALRDTLEQAEPYQSGQVRPYLEPDYNISLQQKKNSIQSAFAPALKAAKTPAQKAAISAQMAEQLAAVDSEEFNINQQNRAGILARNLGEMRGVRDTNLKLAMDAYEKGLGAKEAARQIRRHGEEKLFSDWRAVDAENKRLAMEERYAGWQQDPDGTWHMLRPANIFEGRTVPMADLSSDKEKKHKKTTKTDSKGNKSEVDSEEEKQQYYGGPIAYFGEYFPGIQRTYFGGGAVGGGMGSGMHGMPGHTGSMASRYSPGGDTSYYQKKKKRKKVS